MKKVNWAADHNEGVFKKEMAKVYYCYYTGTGCATNKWASGCNTTHQCRERVISMMKWLGVVSFYRLFFLSLPVHWIHLLTLVTITKTTRGDANERQPKCIYYLQCLSSLKPHDVIPLTISNIRGPWVIIFWAKEVIIQSEWMPWKDELLWHSTSQ